MNENETNESDVIDLTQEEENTSLKQEPSNESAGNESAYDELPQTSINSLKIENKLLLVKTLDQKNTIYKLCLKNKNSEDEIKQLNERIQQLESKQAPEATSSTDDNEFRSVRQDLDHKTQQLNELQSNFDKYLFENNSLIATIIKDLNQNVLENSDECLNVIKTGILSLKDQMSTLQNELNKHKSSLDTVSTESEELKKQNEELVNSLKSLRENTSDLLVSRLRKMISNIESKLEFKNSDHQLPIEDVIAARFRTLVDEIDILKSYNSELKADIESLETKDDKTTTKCKFLENRCDELYSEVKHIKERKEDISIQLNKTSKDNNKLIKDNDRLNSITLHFKQKISGLFERIKYKEGIIRDMKAEIIDLGRDLANSKSSYEFVSCKLNEERKINSLHKTQETDTEIDFKDEIQRLENENLDLKRKISIYEVDINELQNQMQKHKDHVDSSVQINQLKEEIEKLRKENERTPIVQPTPDLKLIEEIQILKAEIEKKIFIINNLSQKKNDYWVALSREQETNRLLKSKIDKFDQMFKQLYSGLIEYDSPVEETNIVIVKQEPRDAMVNNENNLDIMTNTTKRSIETEPLINKNNQGSSENGFKRSCV